MRQIRHPTVVLIRHVEGDFGRRAGAVDEQRDAIGGRSAAQSGSGLDHFAHVDLRGLAGDRRDGGVDLDVVVEAQQAVAVVARIRCSLGTGPEEPPCGVSSEIVYVG